MIVQNFKNENVFILIVFPNKLNKCVQRDFVFPGQLYPGRIKCPGQEKKQENERMCSSVKPGGWAASY